MADVESLPVCGLLLHFRTPARTLDCLGSLLAEGVDRVVLVDNSEDGGRSLRDMQPGLADLRSAGLHVDVVDPGRNLGFAAGVLHGLAHVDGNAGEHILLINSDARFVPGSLREMRRALRGAEIVMPWAQVGDNAERESPLVFYHGLAALYLRKPRRLCVPYPSGACVLARHDVPLGELLDPRFFFYGEDVALGRALANRGLRFEGCEGACIIHAGSASAKNGSMFYEYHMNRAHLLLAGTLAESRAQQAIFAAARLLVLPLRASIRSLRMGSMTPFKGLAMALFDVVRGRWRSLTPPVKAWREAGAGS